MTEAIDKTGGVNKPTSSGVATVAPEKKADAKVDSKKITGVEDSQYQPPTQPTFFTKPSFSVSPTTNPDVPTSGSRGGRA